MPDEFYNPTMTTPPDETEDEPQDDHGNRQLILHAPLGRAVFWLALPVLVQQFLAFCVGFFDIWLSGQLPAGANTDATVAVGFGAYVGWLAGMVFGLVGVGTSALVSRLCGEGNFTDANRVANRSIALAAVMGCLFFIIMQPAAPILVQLLNFGGNANTDSIRYLQIDAFGLLFASISFIGAAALRGAGNMRAPMLIFGVVNILNMIASSILVFGWGPIPPLGVNGIVYGTVIARMTGGCLMLFCLTKGLSRLKLTLSQMRLRGQTAKRILRIGSPSALEGIVQWGGQFLFLMVISRLAMGEESKANFAAHMIGMRMEAITYLPAFAWGAASATIVGQSLGAGMFQRARNTAHYAVMQCAILGLFITTIFFFGSSMIYNFMHDDSLVIATGVTPFRMVALFQIPLLAGIIYTQSLKGAGETRFPLIMTCISTLMIRVPLAYYFGIVLQMGLTGAWLAMCIDMALRALLATGYYHLGNWTKKQL